VLSNCAQLYATRDVPNDFTLKLEFRATPNADSWRSATADLHGKSMFAGLRCHRAPRH
jgi:hypothetical protein